MTSKLVKAIESSDAVLVEQLIKAGENVNIISNKLTQFLELFMILKSRNTAAFIIFPHVQNKIPVLTVNNKQPLTCFVAVCRYFRNGN